MVIDPGQARTSLRDSGEIRLKNSAHDEQTLAFSVTLYGTFCPSTLAVYLCARKLAWLARRHDQHADPRHALLDAGAEGADLAPEVQELSAGVVANLPALVDDVDNVHPGHEVINKGLGNTASHRSGL